MNKRELYRIIGINIKKYRQEYIKNHSMMTQEMLAEAINVSVSLISSLESEKTIKGISITNLYKISVILGVPIDVFFEYEKDWLKQIFTIWKY